MIRFLLIVLLLSTYSQAQVLEVTKQTALLNLQGVTALGDIVLADDVSKLEIREVARVKVNSDASTIIVEASTADRGILPLVTYDANNYTVVGTGKIWISVLCLDFDKKLFFKETKTVELGKVTPPTPPEPPKPPVPDVPADSFDNIGQRVAEWAKGKSSNLELSKCFRESSDNLKSAQPEQLSLTITDQVNKLNERLKNVAGYGSYKEFIDGYNVDLQKRWPMSRGVLADYFKAVSIGFNPAQ